MQHYFITLLLLITVALSSSKVLPMLTDNQHEQNPIGINSQQYDNILSNKFKLRNIINNIFYRSDNTDDVAQQRKTSLYLNTNRGIDKEIHSITNKHDNYNEEGFRKEQRHKYPMQLDRLQDNVFGNWKDNLKLNSDLDAFYHAEEALDPAEHFGEYAEINSMYLDNRDTKYKMTDNSKPWLFFKILLPQHENGFETINTLRGYELPLEDEIKQITSEQKYFNQPLQDANTATKIKQEATSMLQSYPVETSGSKRKRIFAIWSRLQSMAPTNHMPHRRHMHAFYRLPGAGGGGVLTAETRAFIRPPGSPLRWG